MSLPPQAISIKRKRGEEPPESLFLEKNKRHAGHHEFVFRRQIVAGQKASTAPLSVPKVPGIPRILSSKPGEETRPGLDQSHQPATSKTTNGNHETLASIDATRSNATGPRYFALSHRPSNSLSGLTGAQHGTENLALFVEDRHQSILHALAMEPQDQSSAEPSARKRPGVRSRKADASSAKPASAKVDHETERAMQEMAAEYITQTNVSARNDPPDADMTDAGDEDDYVYDTYIRHRNADDAVGSTSMDTMAHSQGNIGILIINEEDEAVWETYADGEDESEHDWDSENDDENAENYYGADYPEDEVASDDEQGLQPYQYRNHAASDDEEYGSEDGAWQDDERNRNPWGHLRSGMPHNDLLDRDDEDDD